MWLLATSSEPGRSPRWRRTRGAPRAAWPARRTPAMRRLRVRLATAFCLCAAPFLPGAVAHGQATLTQDEALRLAFPAPLRIERRTAFLDEAQLDRVRDLAGDGSIRQGVVTYYVAVGPAGPVGAAYFDSHRVRTHGQVLMFVIDAQARLRRTEVLHFAEPPEYRAPERWLELFRGHTLSPRLSLKRDIPNMTGATLTSQAVTQAARRVLALHRVIAPLRTGE